MGHSIHPTRICCRIQVEGTPQIIHKFGTTDIILQNAVLHNFSGSSAELVHQSAQWFAKWTSRSRGLSAAESKLKSNLPKHMETILQPKRILLWKEILEDIEYPDMGAIDELLGGTELVGEVQPFGIFEKSFKPAEVTLEQLSGASKSVRHQQFYKCTSSGDPEVDEKVYSKTLEEVDLGGAIGPIPIHQLPESSVVSRRFGLKQPGKIRLIDDLSASEVNKTVQCAESPKPHSIDFIAALLLKVVEASRGKTVKGRSFDLKSAYKQLAISESSLQFAYVAVYNPVSKRSEVFQLLAAPFGATRSVYSFLRLSHALWYTGVKSSEPGVKLLFR